MGDYAIQARFEASCLSDDLMTWLTSTDGIAGWWSDTVDGSASAPGDRFHVRFPTTEVVFTLDVVELSNGVVEWHVPDSPPWWQGTTIRFEVADDAHSGGSALQFTHTGFDPRDPMIAVITPAWVRFLDNLVAVAQTGSANPAVVN